MRDPREELVPGEPGLKQNINNTGMQSISKTPGLTPEPKWREPFPNKAGAQCDRPQAGATSAPAAPKPQASTVRVGGQPVAQPPKPPTYGEPLKAASPIAGAAAGMGTPGAIGPVGAGAAGAQDLKDRFFQTGKYAPSANVGAPPAPAPRPVRQAARSTAEALEMQHPGFGSMTREQKAAALRSRPATSNVG